MIDVEFTIRNYRCIGDQPAVFRVSDGFTALIGTNNSGKSSLLRLLYEIRPLFEAFLQRDPGHSMLRGTRRNWWSPTLLPGERVFQTGNDRDVQITIGVIEGPAGPFLFEGEPVAVDLTYRRDGVTESVVRLASGRVLGDPDQPMGEGALETDPFMAVMRELQATTYIGPFRNAINIGAQQKYYDIQTGDAFVRTFADYKSGANPANNEAVAQLLTEVRRIFNFDSLDLNATPDQQALQLTVDGRSYRLTEQGAGLAHFIVVLVNALVKRPSFLLIDEPELNLNASLQLDFLSTLAKYTKYGVIFATHSVGLARTAADRIYTLSKPRGGSSRVRLYDSEPELVTLLGQLAFDKRPDLGFSRVLLVEGKSELRALAQLLRLYGKEHEILMLPLHGDEMIRGDVQQELSDLKRIGGDIKYLIDSERGSKGAPLAKNRQAFVDLCAKLEIDGIVLERRALENYLPQHAVTRAFGKDAQALGLYEKKGVSQGWPKTGNWRAAAEMTRQDLDGTDLGTFLEKV